MVLLLTQRSAKNRTPSFPLPLLNIEPKHHIDFCEAKQTIPCKTLTPEIHSIYPFLSRIIKPKTIKIPLIYSQNKGKINKIIIKPNTDSCSKTTKHSLGSIDHYQISKRKVKKKRHALISYRSKQPNKPEYVYFLPFVCAAGSEMEETTTRLPMQPPSHHSLHFPLRVSPSRPPKL
ncbi:unnamed protein product [Lactuca virosa]|uniref:Uncharacterized protein n=1 Tax=Lactuca virosa TaxID=75947 RepID=A0AAU9NQ39_9ASTR|nr:unnamed protein product [Lactuca virosa]